MYEYKMSSVLRYLKQRLTNSFVSTGNTGGNGSTRIHSVNYILDVLGEQGAVPAAVSGGSLESVYTLPAASNLVALLNSLSSDPSIIRVAEGTGITDIGKTVTVGVAGSPVRATFQLVASEDARSGFPTGCPNGVGLTVTNVIRGTTVDTDAGSASLARV
jgi:hypothetical protein